MLRNEGGTENFNQAAVIIRPGYQWHTPTDVFEYRILYFQFDYSDYCINELTTA